MNNAKASVWTPPSLRFSFAPEAQRKQFIRRAMFCGVICQVLVAINWLPRARRPKSVLLFLLANCARCDPGFGGVCNKLGDSARRDQLSGRRRMALSFRGKFNVIPRVACGACCVRMFFRRRIARRFLREAFGGPFLSFRKRSFLLFFGCCLRFWFRRNIKILPLIELAFP